MWRWPAMLIFLCACGPPPLPEGPRQTGAGSSAFVGDAQLRVGYRYDPKPGRTMAFWVDVSGQGEVGKISVAIDVDGMEILEGNTTITTTVPKSPVSASKNAVSPSKNAVSPSKNAVSPSKTESHDVLLGRLGKETATITVTTRHVDKDIELTSDVLKFLLNAEEGIRECRPTDDICR